MQDQPIPAEVIPADAIPMREWVKALVFVVVSVAVVIGLVAWLVVPALFACGCTQAAG